MTREQYESLPLTELKAIAKTRGIRGISGAKKIDIIDAMLERIQNRKNAKVRQRAELLVGSKEVKVGLSPEKNVAGRLQQVKKSARGQALI